MQQLALSAVTLSAFVFALRVRRFTWGNDWEKAITLSVLLQLVALVLTSPYSTPFVGDPIARWTGFHNLDSVIGHDLYLVAASSVLYHILYSLHDDDGLRRHFRAFVELPCTAVLPLLMVTYAQSDSAKQTVKDLFESQDETLQPYWIVLTGTVGYLLVFSAYHFAIALRDDAYRWECTGYLLASIAGVTACILRFGGNAWDIPALPVWGAIAACGVLFAGTSGLQWKRQLARPQPELV